MSKSNYVLRDRNTGKYVAIKNCTQESNLCYHNVTWSADPVTFVRGTYEYAQSRLYIFEGYSQEIKGEIQLSQIALNSLYEIYKSPNTTGYPTLIGSITHHEDKIKTLEIIDCKFRTRRNRRRHEVITSD